MLKRLNRIRTKAEYDRLYKRGRKINTSVFILRYLPNNLTLGRVGLVISSKVDKKATIRNRLKRQITEIIRLHHLKKLSGYDCALVCLPRIKNRSAKQLAQELQSLVSKINAN